MDDIEPFDSPKILLGRAREHIDELETLIKIFFDRRPYAPIIDIDRETRQKVYKVRLTAKLPGSWRAVLKDTTSNLRDALDHAVYAAAASLGNTAAEKTGFPFANDATHLKGELGTWKFNDVPGEIHPLLESFRPYPGGNNLLVALNRVRNPNTHRILVPVGFASLGFAMSVQHITINGGGQIGYSRWNAAKNEVEYMRLGLASPNPEYEIKIAFDATFGDVEIVGGKPVIATLREFATEVERVILAIEAETARILIERAA